MNAPATTALQIGHRRGPIVLSPGRQTGATSPSLSMPSAFHVAPTGARAHILEHGLVASGPRPRWQKYDVVEQPAGVYFWDSVERALRWASDFFRLVAGAEYGLSDIWRVDLDDLEVLVDPVLGDQGARYVADSIDASRVSLLLPAPCA
jgi:hypothetical protein